MTAGVSHPGHDSGRTWSLSQLIESLNLADNNKGVLRKLSDFYLRTGRVDLPEEDQAATEEEQEDDDPGSHLDEEDPELVSYTPGAQVKHVWIAVEKFCNKNKMKMFRLPNCVDGASIKKPAFLCILAHLKSALKNQQSVLRGEKTYEDLTTDALGYHAVKADLTSEKTAGSIAYNRIRVPPFNLGDQYKDLSAEANKKTLLQVNPSIPKENMRRVARFLLEINCYACTLTGLSDPWHMPDDDDGKQTFGKIDDTFQKHYPLFTKCVAALYQKTHLRMMQPDSVADVEKDTYTVPPFLFSFRQKEWPQTLWFPASNHCRNLMPDPMLEAVLAARHAMTVRLTIGNVVDEDGNVVEVEEQEDVAYTGTTRRELAEGIKMAGGLVGKKKVRQTTAVKKNKKKTAAAKKAASSSAAAGGDDDDETAPDYDCEEDDLPLGTFSM